MIAMAVNKVVYAGTTIIDITDTTAEASDVAQGKYFYLPSGQKVVGTASTGGGGMNIQAYHGMDYVRANSYSATDVTLTVTTTGTYTVSWMGYRNTTSGTGGSQLYINGSGYGSANTSFTSSYGQSNILYGVQLDAGDVLVIRARSRNSSYYMYVGNLVIEQTA